MKLTKVSDSLYRISEGRDTIGWCRRGASDWKAEANSKIGEGATPGEAFHALARKRNDAYAQKEGFKDYRDLIEANNKAVAAEVKLWNTIVDEVAKVMPKQDTSWLRARVRRRKVRL
jgi:hypothetical protein